MKKHLQILKDRFGKDSLMALATVDEQGTPWVRTIDAIFDGDSFYTVTYSLSNKMKHIAIHPLVAISGEWFSGHAVAEDLGQVRLAQNKEIADKLRMAFAAWYGNGHINEEDPRTVILKMKLTDGTLFSDGVRYDF